MSDIDLLAAVTKAIHDLDCEQGDACRMLFDLHGRYARYAQAAIDAVRAHQLPDNTFIAPYDITIVRNDDTDEIIGYLYGKRPESHGAVSDARPLHKRPVRGVAALSDPSTACPSRNPTRTEPTRPTRSPHDRPA